MHTLNFRGGRPTPPKAQVLLLDSPASSQSPLWKAVEAVSMIRLVRLGYVFPDAQDLLLVAAKSSSVVFPLLFALALLTYLWSVFGVALFGGDER